MGDEGEEPWKTGRTEVPRYAADLWRSCRLYHTYVVLILRPILPIRYDDTRVPGVEELGNDHLSPVPHTFSLTVISPPPPLAQPLAQPLTNPLT